MFPISTSRTSLCFSHNSILNMSVVTYLTLKSITIYKAHISAIIQTNAFVPNKYRLNMTFLFTGHTTINCYHIVGRAGISSEKRGKAIL